MGKFRAIVSNDKFVFVSTKYATYAIYFIISLIIANKLGLFYFGVYGFIRLLIQYFTYSNLGVNYSSIVIMSENKFNNTEKDSKVLFTSIIITFISLLFFYLCFVWLCEFFNFYFYSKYNISKYACYLFFIILIKQFNQLFINIYRVYDNLKIINLAYIIPCIGELIVLFTGSGKSLLDNIMWAMIFSNGIVFIIFLLDGKFSMTSHLDIEVIRKLLNRGIKLLLYNVSFYFIILVAKSYMSSNFGIEDFAQYSFSYNMSDAVMLLNNSISFLIYPNLLNRLSTASNSKESLFLMKATQQNYMVAASVIIIIAIIVSPFLYLVVPEYIKSSKLLQILLLSQLLVANSFIMTTYLVQQKKEISLILLGGATILVLLIFSVILFNISQDIIMVSYSLAFALVFYNIGLGFLVKKRINLCMKELVQYFLQPIYFIPLIVFLFASSMSSSCFVLVLFILLSFCLLYKRLIILIKSVFYEK